MSNPLLERCLLKWTSSILGGDYQIQSLQSFTDGSLVARLVQAVAPGTADYPPKAPITSRMEQLACLNKSLHIVQTQWKFPLENITADAIIAGSTTSISALLWKIVLKDISGHEDLLLSSSTQNLNTSSLKPPPAFEVGLRMRRRSNSTGDKNQRTNRDILIWIQNYLESSKPEVAKRITDLKNSWLDGLGFLALLHTYDPALVLLWSDIVAETSNDTSMWCENCNTAFEVASTHFGLPHLFTGEELQQAASSGVDIEQPLILYLSLLSRAIRTAQMDFESLVPRVTRDLEAIKSSFAAISIQLSSVSLALDFNINASEMLRESETDSVGGVDGVKNISAAIDKNVAKIRSEIAMQVHWCQHYCLKSKKVSQALQNSTLRLGELFDEVSRTADAMLKSVVKKQELESRVELYRQIIIQAYSRIHNLKIKVDDLPRDRTLLSDIELEYPKIKASFTELKPLPDNEENGTLFNEALQKALKRVTFEFMGLEKRIDEARQETLSKMNPKEVYEHETERLHEWMTDKKAMISAITCDDDYIGNMVANFNGTIDPQLESLNSTLLSFKAEMESTEPQLRRLRDLCVRMVGNGDRKKKEYMATQKLIDDTWISLRNVFQSKSSAVEMALRVREYMIAAYIILDDLDVIKDEISVLPADLRPEELAPLVRAHEDKLANIDHSIDVLSTTHEDALLLNKHAQENHAVLHRFSSTLKKSLTERKEQSEDYYIFSSWFDMAVDLEDAFAEFNVLLSKLEKLQESRLIDISSPLSAYEKTVMDLKTRFYDLVQTKLRKLLQVYESVHSSGKFTADSENLSVQESLIDMQEFYGSVTNSFNVIQPIIEDHELCVRQLTKILAAYMEVEPIQKALLEISEELSTVTSTGASDKVMESSKLFAEQQVKFEAWLVAHSDIIEPSELLSKAKVKILSYTDRIAASFAKRMSDTSLLKLYKTMSEKLLPLEANIDALIVKIQNVTVPDIPKTDKLNAVKLASDKAHKALIHLRSVREQYGKDMEKITESSKQVFEFKPDLRTRILQNEKTLATIDSFLKRKIANITIQVDCQILIIKIQQIYTVHNVEQERFLDECQKFRELECLQSLNVRSLEVLGKLLKQAQENVENSSKERELIQSHAVFKAREESGRDTKSDLPGRMIKTCNEKTEEYVDQLKRYDSELKKEVKNLENLIKGTLAFYQLMEKRFNIYSSTLDLQKRLEIAAQSNDVGDLASVIENASDEVTRFTADLNVMKGSTPPFSVITDSKETINFVLKEVAKLGAMIKDTTVLKQQKIAQIEESKFNSSFEGQLREMARLLAPLFQKCQNWKSLPVAEANELSAMLSYHESSLSTMRSDIISTSPKSNLPIVIDKHLSSIREGLANLQRSRQRESAQFSLKRIEAAINEQSLAMNSFSTQLDIIVELSDNARNEYLTYASSGIRIAESMVYDIEANFDIYVQMHVMPLLEHSQRVRKEVELFEIDDELRHHLEIESSLSKMHNQVGNQIAEKKAGISRALAFVSIATDYNSAAALGLKINSEMEGDLITIIDGKIYPAGLKAISAKLNEFSDSVLEITTRIDGQTWNSPMMEERAVELQNLVENLTDKLHFRTSASELCIVVGQAVESVCALSAKFPNISKSNVKEELSPSKYDEYLRALDDIEKQLSTIEGTVTVTHRSLANESTFLSALIVFNGGAVDLAKDVAYLTRDYVVKRNQAIKLTKAIAQSTEAESLRKLSDEMQNLLLNCDSAILDRAVVGMNERESVELWKTLGCRPELQRLTDVLADLTSNKIPSLKSLVTSAGLRVNKIEQSFAPQMKRRIADLDFELVKLKAAVKLSDSAAAVKSAAESFSAHLKGHQEALKRLFKEIQDEFEESGISEIIVNLRKVLESAVEKSSLFLGDIKRFEDAFKASETLRENLDESIIGIRSKLKNGTKETICVLTPSILAERQIADSKGAEITASVCEICDRFECGPASEYKWHDIFREMQSKSQMGFNACETDVKYISTNAVLFDTIVDQAEDLMRNFKRELTALREAEATTDSPLDKLMSVFEDNIQRVNRDYLGWNQGLRKDLIDEVLILRESRGRYREVQGRIEDLKQEALKLFKDKSAIVAGDIEIQALLKKLANSSQQLSTYSPDLQWIRLKEILTTDRDTVDLGTLIESIDGILAGIDRIRDCTLQLSGDISQLCSNESILADKFASVKVMTLNKAYGELLNDCDKSKNDLSRCVDALKAVGRLGTVMSEFHRLSDELPTNIGKLAVVTKNTKDHWISSMKTLVAETLSLFEHFKCCQEVGTEYIVSSPLILRFYDRLAGDLKRIDGAYQNSTMNVKSSLEKYHSSADAIQEKVSKSLDQDPSDAALEGHLDRLNLIHQYVLSIDEIWNAESAAEIEGEIVEMFHLFGVSIDSLIHAGFRMQPVIRDASSFSYFDISSLLTAVTQQIETCKTDLSRLNTVLSTKNELANHENAMISVYKDLAAFCTLRWEFELEQNGGFDGLQRSWTHEQRSIESHLKGLEAFKANTRETLKHANNSSLDVALGNLEKFERKLLNLIDRKSLDLEHVTRTLVFYNKLDTLSRNFNETFVIAENEIMEAIESSDINLMELCLGRQGEFQATGFAQMENELILPVKQEAQKLISHDVYHAAEILMRVTTVAISFNRGVLVLLVLTRRIKDLEDAITISKFDATVKLIMEDLQACLSSAQKMYDEIMDTITNRANFCTPFSSRNVIKMSLLIESELFKYPADFTKRYEGFLCRINRTCDSLEHEIVIASIENNLQIQTCHLITAQPHIAADINQIHSTVNEVRQFLDKCRRALTLFDKSALVFNSADLSELWVKEMDTFLDLGQEEQMQYLEQYPDREIALLMAKEGFLKIEMLYPMLKDEMRPELFEDVDPDVVAELIASLDMRMQSQKQSLLQLQAQFQQAEEELQFSMYQERKSLAATAIS